MKKSQIKIGAILSYVSLALTSVVGLVYTPIMLRYMGQAEYGLYSLVASFISYLTILDLGFGNAIVVYTAKFRARKDREEEEKLHGMFFVIYTILGVIAGVLGFILYLNVGNLFGSEFTLEELSKAKVMMGILTFNLVVTFPLSIFGNIITAYEEFVFSKLVNIIRQLLMPLVMIPLLIMGYKSISMIVVVTVLNVACLLTNMVFCFKKLNIKIKFKGFDKKLLKEIFGFSIFIFLNTIVDKINWSLDQVVLGAVAGTVVVAIYSVASQLNNIYLSFSTAISGVLLPKMTKMIENKASDEEVSNEFIKTGRIQYLIMALVVIGFIIFGAEFINIWSGSEYSESYIIACILMIPVTVPLIQNMGINILQAKNRNKFRTLVYVGISLANVVLSIPLAKLYGGIGAAIGTAISLIIGNIIIMNIYYYKAIKINIPKFWKSILKMSIPMIIIAIPTYLINKSLIYNTWISFIIKVCVFSVIYCITVYLFAMNDYEKGIIKNLFSKLTRNLKKKEKV